MIGHEFHRSAPLTNTQVTAEWGVGQWTYWTKDRNDQGEPTGRPRFISERKYHPSTPGAYYSDDKWTYLIKDGSGEKAQVLGWAEEGDLEHENPNPPDLLGDSP